MSVPPCINQDDSHTFEDSDTFSTTATATQATGDGTYYIHVQAQDQAGNQGDVVTVSAQLDASPPVVTGIQNDLTLTRSKTWTWGCNKRSCSYRYVINSNLSHSFSSSNSFGSDNRATSDPNRTRSNGTWYLHVQARDSGNNVGAVKRVSFEVDVTSPMVTGLSNSAGRGVRSVTWNWGCSDAPNPCTYRFAVVQSSSHTFADTDPFTNVTRATQDTGDGTWYLHVEAQDAAGNISAAARVSAVLDNTGPSISGPPSSGSIGSSDPETLGVKSKTWSWRCGESGCKYRHRVVKQSGSGAPSPGLSGGFSSTSSASQNSGTGTYWLFVQAQDSLGNEGPIFSTYQYVDNTAPTVTGITANTRVAYWQKIWNWGCNEGTCDYKSAVGESASQSLPGSWSSNSSQKTAVGAANGTYYVNIKARDSAGNESSVFSYSGRVGFDPRELQIGPHGAIDPFHMKWSWNCGNHEGGEKCGSNGGYRYVLGSASASASTSEYNHETLNTGSTSKVANGAHFLHLQAKTRNQAESPVVNAFARTLKRIDTNGHHVCLVESGGGVKCWGKNDYAQVGYKHSGSGSSQKIAYPYTVKSSSSSNLGNAVEVSTGWNHSCALVDNSASNTQSVSSSVKCWGRNNRGQLGRTTTSNNPDRYAKDVTGLTDVVSIDAGDHSTCAVLQAGSIKCWGYNNKGQLGNNSNTNSWAPVTVSGITNAIQVSVGIEFACALLSTWTSKMLGRRPWGSPR